MKYIVRLLPILLLVGCEQPTIGDMVFPDGVVQHVVRYDATTWLPCPPNLPQDCEMALLEGSPRNPELFTIRFRVGGTFLMPPHTHPRDERVTLLEGRVAVGFGDDATRENAMTFMPGDYYVNARGAVHTVWADTSSIIQITGIGPWEVDFVGANAP